MNCHDARLQLEVARPGSDDLMLSEFQSASAHLDGCRDCRASFQSRQALDGRISATMLDVPIPAGLKERLLESLNLGGPRRAAVESGEGTRRASRPRQRASVWDSVRNRIALAVGLSACLLAALFVLYPNQPPLDQLTLGEVRNSANLELEDLEAFDKNFVLKLPKVPWSGNAQISFPKPPKGDLKGKDGKHRCASYGFQVTDARGRVFYGVLLVLPASVLDAVPGSNFFSPTGVGGSYLSKQPFGKVQAVAWKEGDFVYVCFMQVGAPVNTLKNVLYPLPV